MSVKNSFEPSKSTCLPMTSAPRSEATALASEKAAAYCRFSLPDVARDARAVEEENKTIRPLVAELT